MERDEEEVADFSERYKQHEMIQNKEGGLERRDVLKA